MPEVEALQREIGTLLAGHPVDLALAVLIAELSRVISSVDLPTGERRGLIAMLVTQLQESIAKNLVSQANTPSR